MPMSASRPKSLKHARAKYMFGIFSLNRSTDSQHPRKENGSPRDLPDLEVQFPDSSPHTTIRGQQGEWVCHVVGQFYGRSVEDTVRRLVSDLELGKYRGIGAISGSFLMVVYFQRNHEVLLISDKFSSQRLFYAVTGERLLFSSRLMALKKTGFPLELTRETLLQFLTFRFIFQGTILRSVDALAPASVLRCSRSGLKEVSYWQWSRRVSDGANSEVRSSRELCRELAHHWSRAVDRSLGARSSFALLLSGGFDSRAILGEILKNHPTKKVLAVSYGSPGSFDYELGSLVARRSGIRHLAVDLSLQRDFERLFSEQCIETDGMIDLLHAPNECYRQIVDFELDVVNGCLGDALSGGAITRTTRERALRSKADAQRTCWSLVFQGSMGLFSEVPSLMNCSQPDYVDEINAIVYRQYERQQWRSAFDAHAGFASSVFDSRFSLVCVTKGSDRINYVYPFFDSDWINFWESVPGELWRDQRLYREFLRTEYPDLYALPTKRMGQQGLPTDALRKYDLHFGNNPDINIVDYARMLREDDKFAGFIGDLLDSLANREMVNADAMKKMWRRHRQGGENRSFMLMRLASLEVVVRSFG